MKENIEKIQNKLQKYLDKARYEHTIGVMYTAASLAMCHGADINKAMLAGLLHDCAKCIPPETKIKLCNKYHLKVSNIELENPTLLHAKLGAFIAARKYGVGDGEILDAIISHTTGRPDMTLLEKILYVADYIEPGRKELPVMAKARALAFTDIDECLYLLLRDALNYLKKRRIPIDPMTENTYNYYKEHLKKKEVM